MVEFQQSLGQQTALCLHQIVEELHLGRAVRVLLDEADHFVPVAEIILAVDCQLSLNIPFGTLQRAHFWQAEQPVGEGQQEQRQEYPRGKGGEASAAVLTESFYAPCDAGKCQHPAQQRQRARERELVVQMEHRLDGGHDKCHGHGGIAVHPQPFQP